MARLLLCSLDIRGFDTNLKGNGRIRRRRARNLRVETGELETGEWRKMSISSLPLTEKKYARSCHY